MNIIVSLDTAFGLFNNIPPRVDLCELDLQLSCDPVYFDTSGYEEMVIRSQFPRQKMKMLDAFQKLFMTQSGTSNRFDPVERHALNSWDLFILIHRKCSSLLDRASYIICCSHLTQDFISSFVLFRLAAALLQSFTSHTFDNCASLCCCPGSPKTRNSELENHLGRNQVIYFTGRTTRNGL